MDGLKLGGDATRGDDAERPHGIEGKGRTMNQPDRFSYRALAARACLQTLIDRRGYTVAEIDSYAEQIVNEWWFLYDEQPERLKFMAIMEAYLDGWDTGYDAGLEAGLAEGDRIARIEARRGCAEGGGGGPAA